MKCVVRKTVVGGSTSRWRSSAIRISLSVSLKWPNCVTIR